MIVKVYGVAAASTTVRVYAGSTVDGSTAGYRERNIVKVADTTATAVARNAYPSRPARFASTAATSAAATTRTAGDHARQPSTTSRAATPVRAASRRASARTGPAVLSATNTAP